MIGVRSLAILARTPRLYETKTRLAPVLGASGALQAHIDLVEATLSRLAPMRNVETSLWVTEVDDVCRAWAATFEVALNVQPRGDLGQKMQQVLDHGLSAGATSACLVGTDCPPIDQVYVNQAFTQLETHDVVLGPAQDGGYGLIGVSRVCSGLFDDVSWGTAEVFAQTLERIRQQGLSVAVLDMIWDVDTPQDWRRYLTWKVDNPG